MPWTPQGSALDAMRATHAKAYAPWTRDEDGDLKRRHQAGERVDAIAAEFGRKPGAIRSRLKKLGLGLAASGGAPSPCRRSSWGLSLCGAC